MGREPKYPSRGIVISEAGNEENQEHRHRRHTAEGLQPGADRHTADDGGLYGGHHPPERQDQQPGRGNQRTAEAVHIDHLKGNHGRRHLPKHGPEHPDAGLHRQRPVQRPGGHGEHARRLRGQYLPRARSLRRPALRPARPGAGRNDHGAAADGGGAGYRRRGAGAAAGPRG